MSYHLHKHLSKKKKTKVVDHCMMGASIVHPLTAMPQVYQIYATQNASGVSLLTWVGFMLLGIIFLAYGILHKIRPMIVSQILWFTVDFLIVLGILLYR